MSPSLVITPKEMSGETRQEFLRLIKVPPIAWPSMSLLIIFTIVVAGLWYLALTNTVSPWICGVLVGLTGNWLFTPLHDATHGSLASNRRVNDWGGRIGLALLMPWATLELFRWGHQRHHRYTGGQFDPDRWSHGPWWQLPFRWATIDVGYFIEIVKHGDRATYQMLGRTLVQAAAAGAVAVVLTLNHYGEQVFWMMLVPSRVALIGLGFTFFWLPHVPHDTEQAKNFTRATTVRLGHERFFNFMLQYQNFHLLHHMYPTAPSHNNPRLWHLLEPQLRQRELAVQHGFAIQPKIELPTRLVAPT
ncbi:fatty acid desaturase [Sphingobium chlorophenolicum L-1]|uniref:Fatty acid desaturase n=1 Tax=Sphingobium chlorophenolicum L-1 TaxID=690566 RepID=F6EUH0_SPHCR|nr:fatty acid desaturase [Sphingobium chlorophenolicum]AEG47864.1 fatty acid desaturase [Sphingobium chlorophenolicum L-1]